MQDDKSIEELTKSFSQKTSLKKSQRFTSNDFEQKDGAESNIAEQIKQQIESSQPLLSKSEPAVVKAGKRIRNNSLANEEEAQDETVEMYKNQGGWGHFVKVQSENDIASKAPKEGNEKEDERPAKKSRSF